MAIMRSPNYPAISLRDSYQRTKLLWIKEKRTAVPAEVAAKAIGYSGLSGPSRTVLASMKKYGLVDSDDKTVRVSDLALRIIHPANDLEEVKALQEAALKPELFSQLYSTHQDASDDALRSYLITKLNFSEAGARQVIKAFRDTLGLAQLDQPGVKPPIEVRAADGIQIEDNTHVDVRYAADSLRIDSPTLRSASTGQPLQTLTVPVGPDVFAEVRIRGGELRAEHLEALREYLSLAQKWAKAEPTYQEGDTVEYVDAYTGETKYGRIDKMYGSTAIVRTITKDEAGPNPKKFTPKPDPARTAQRA
jgi:hypothetical protein